MPTPTANIARLARGTAFVSGVLFALATLISPAIALGLAVDATATVADRVLLLGWLPFGLFVALPCIVVGSGKSRSVTAKTWLCAPMIIVGAWLLAALVGPSL